MNESMNVEESHKGCTFMWSEGKVMKIHERLTYLRSTPWVVVWNYKYAYMYESKLTALHIIV